MSYVCKAWLDQSSSGALTEMILPHKRASTIGDTHSSVWGPRRSSESSDPVSKVKACQACQAFASR